MRQKSLSKWLKGIIIGVGLCGLIFYALIVPMLGRSIAAFEGGAVAGWFWPWLAFLWGTAVPCAVALAFAWRIAANIGRNRSFCLANARLLKWISMLAAGDAAYYFAGNVVLLFLNMNHPGVVLLSMLVTFVGAAVSVAAAALSHLTEKAAALQDQCDLTI